MSALTWDNVGERFYEVGVDRGVVFPYKNDAYQKGVAWNGLTAVNENPSGAEATALYADNIKYLNLVSSEEFGCTIEAFTYPDEYAECDGSAEPTDGVYLAQQPRKPFGFAYRTRIGNDTSGTEKGYKIHLVYNALAAPSSKSYGTINDSPDAMTLSWEVTTTPINVSGYKPVAHIIIDSTKVGSSQLATFEEILYGNEVSDSRLPLPDEVLTIFRGSSTPSIELSRHSINVTSGDSFELAVTKVPNDASVTWASTSDSVASVSNGTVTAGTAGNAIITASITVDGVTYSDTCTVIVAAEANG